MVTVTDGATTGRASGLLVWSAVSSVLASIYLARYVVGVMLGPLAFGVVHLLALPASVVVVWMMARHLRRDWRWPRLLGITLATGLGAFVGQILGLGTDAGRLGGLLVLGGTLALWLVLVAATRCAGDDRPIWFLALIGAICAGLLSLALLVLAPSVFVTGAEVSQLYYELTRCLAQPALAALVFSLLAGRGRSIDSLAV